MAGADTWEIFIRSEPDATEADWAPFFTEAIQKLNTKKLDYLMGRSVEQTFKEDGRPPGESAFSRSQLRAAGVTGANTA